MVDGNCHNIREKYEHKIESRIRFGINLIVKQRTLFTLKKKEKYMIDDEA